jgi:type II secretory pathway component PulF
MMMRGRRISRGRAWRSSMVMVVVVMVAMMAMVFAVVTRPVVRRWFHRRQVRLPVVGSMVRRHRRLGIGCRSRCFCRREGMMVRR